MVNPEKQNATTFLLEAVAGVENLWNEILKNIEVGLPPDYMRVLYLESQLDIFDSDS
jgi:hypothetical protein